MQNSKNLQKTYDLAKNSQNSAMDEQRAYMKSLSASINAFKENIKGLSLDLSDESLFSTAINGANDLVSVVRTLVKEVGAFPTIIASISAGLGMANKKVRAFMTDNNIFGFKTISDKINGVDGIGGYKGRIEGLISIQKQNIQTTKEHVSAQKSLGNSTVIASGKLGLMQTKLIALKGASIAVVGATRMLQGILSFGIGLGISMAVDAVFKLADGFINAKKHLQDFNDEYAKTSGQNTETINEAESKFNKIQSLQSQLADTKNETERIALQKELNQLQGDMCNNLLPQTASGYSKEGKQIANNNKLIEQQIAMKKREREDKAIEFVSKNGGSNGIKKQMDDYKHLIELQSKYSNAVKGIEKDDLTVGDPSKKLKSVNEDISNTVTNITAAQRAIEDLKASGWSSKQIDSKFGIDDVEKTLDGFINNMNQASSGMDTMGNSAQKSGLQMQDLDSALQETEDTLDKLAGKFNHAAQEIEFIEKTIKEFNKNGGKLSVDTKGEMFSNYKDLIPFLKDGSTFASNMNKRMSELKTSLNETENELIATSDAGVNTFNNIGGSAENASDRTQKASADATNKQADDYGKDANNHNSLINAKNSDLGFLLAQVNANSSSMVNNQAGDYSKDANNWTSYLQGKLLTYNEYIKKIQRGANAAIQARNAMASEKLYDKFKDSGSSLQGMYDGYKDDWAKENGYNGDSVFSENAQKVSESGIDTSLSNHVGSFEGSSHGSDYPNKVGNSYGGSGSKGKKKKSSSGTKVDIKDIEEEVDRYKSLQDTLDDVNNSLERNNQLKDMAQGSGKLKYMREEKKLYVEQKEAIHDLINAKKKEAREIEGVLNSNGFNASNGDISNYQHRLNQLKNEANAMSNSNKKKEDAIKKYKKLEEQANKYFDLTSKELPNLQKEFEDVNKAMKDSNKEYIELIGSTEREMVNVIKENIDKKKELYNKDWDERKKLLDEEYDKKKETYDKETEALKKALQDQKDIMNKQFEDEDYKSQLSDKEEELAKLQQQIDEASRNTTLEGQNMLNDLLEQKKKLEEERDKFIKDHQQNIANDLFDKEMDKIDKDSQDKNDKLDDEHKLNSDILDKEKEEREAEWDKHFSAEKISELAKSLVHNGFAEVNGEVLKLGDAVKKYFVSQGEVFSDSSLKLQELMDKIKLAQGLAQDLNEMNKNLGVSSSNNISSFANNPRYNMPLPQNFRMVIPPIQHQKANITVKSDLHIGEIKNGQSPEELKAMFNENNENLIREINKKIDY